MKRIYTLLLAGVFVTLPVKAQVTNNTAAPSGSNTKVDDVASAIARNMGAQDQFRSFLLQVLSSTSTAQMIAARIGAERSQALLAVEVQKAVGTYGAEWESNLADSYRETLTPEDLIAAKRAVDAKDQVALMPFMSKVGQVMEAKSTPLLKKAAAEALGRADAESEKNK